MVCRQQKYQSCPTLGVSIYNWIHLAESKPWAAYSRSPGFSSQNDPGYDQPNIELSIKLLLSVRPSSLQSLSRFIRIPFSKLSGHFPKSQFAIFQCPLLVRMWRKCVGKSRRIFLSKTWSTIYLWFIFVGPCPTENFVSKWETRL